MEYDLLTEKGFEEMYHEYFPKIYNYIFYRTLSREDTDDIVSDVFFKAARNAHVFDACKSSFSTWLYTITKHTLTDYYRKKTPACVPYDEDNTVKVNFEDQHEGIVSEKRREIFKELAVLPEKERLVIYYKYFEGYTNRKIALVLGMNESTVGTVLQRSLKKLRTDNMRELYLR